MEPIQAQIKDVMRVRTARIRQDSDIRHAAEIVALSGVSDLMVVDDEDKFIGVISEGDILRTALPDIDEILDEGGTLEDCERGGYCCTGRGDQLSEVGGNVRSEGCPGGGTELKGSGCGDGYGAVLGVHGAAAGGQGS